MESVATLSDVPTTPVHGYMVRSDVTLNVTLADSPCSDGRTGLINEYAPGRKRCVASK